MNGQTVFIPPVQVNAAWPQVEPFIVTALTKAHGELDAQQVRLLCVQGQAEIFVHRVDDLIRAVAVVEYVNYPNMRVANVIAIAGRGVVDLADALAEWKAFLKKERACQQLRGYAPEALARLWRRVGVNELYRVVGVEL
jgi:hypothetical protein